MKNNQKPTNKKQHKWLKVLRFALYCIAIPSFAVGIGLIKTSNLSASYANGTHDAEYANGLIIFLMSTIVLCSNIYWGIIRWFLRGYHESWRPGQIIAKLIGGGIWRTLLVVPLFVISLLFITPLLTGLIANNVLAETSGFIPYDPDYSMHRLEYLNEHFDDLPREQVVQELSDLMLEQLEFDPQAEISKHMPSIFTSNASATTHNVAKLTKAVLSTKERFVVFYTTRGDDAISDTQATDLAAMLEEIIDNYETNLGMEYSYQQVGVGILKDIGIKNVLKANNIDANILKTAMPVYVANPFTEQSNILASYASTEFTKIIAQIALKLGNIPFFADGENADIFKFYESAPSFPFINIGPDSVNSPDLASVTAHEIGHHFVHLSNNATYGDAGSTEDFIDETVPNWMAIHTTENLPVEGVINGGHYNKTYLAKGTSVRLSDSVPDFSGYPPYALLENYADIVPDGQSKIMDAVYHGNALERLHELAGSSLFAKVMTTLAEKNLTGDYGGKIVNYILPKGENLYCTDSCTHTYQINPASTQYLYFTPDEYTDTRVNFVGSDDIAASVVGKTTNNSWEIIATANANAAIDFSGENYHKYQVVALAVSNANIFNQSSYVVNITNSNLVDIITDEGDYDFGLSDDEMFTDLGGGCYGFNVNKALDYLNRFIGLGSEFLGVIAAYDESGAINEMKNEYDSSMDEVSSNIEQTKQELAPYNITLCVSQISHSQSFESALIAVKNSLGYSFNIYDGQDGDTRISVNAGFDVFSRRAKAYVLASDGTDAGLVTISISPR